MDNEPTQEAFFQLEGPDGDGFVWACSPDGRDIWCQNLGPTQKVAEVMSQWLGTYRLRRAGNGSVSSEWLPVSETYPDPNERVLVATDDGEVGIAHWEPDAGWLMQIEMGEMEVEPLYWMPLPLHPGIEVAL